MNFGKCPVLKVQSDCVGSWTLQNIWMNIAEEATKSSVDHTLCLRFGFGIERCSRIGWFVVWPRFVLYNINMNAYVCCSFIRHLVFEMICHIFLSFKSLQLQSHLLCWECALNLWNIIHILILKFSTFLSLVSPFWVSEICKWVSRTEYIHVVRPRTRYSSFINHERWVSGLSGWTTSRSPYSPRNFLIQAAFTYPPLIGELIAIFINHLPSCCQLILYTWLYY